MKTINAILFFLLCLNFNPVNAQLVFIEEGDWGSEEFPLSPDSLNLHFEMTPDSAAAGDSIHVKFFYESNQLAIEGKCILDKYNTKSKRGIWNFYYENGNLWSRREYNKRGRNTGIHELKSSDGEDLNQGFARYFGRNNYMNGYNYIYGETGDIQYVAHYISGKIVNKYDKDHFNENQLSRLNIRIFEIDENTYLEELSFEEAYELQKTNNKTILLNASTNWNGYTKKGYKKLFTKPYIAEFINENFILAYLNIEDTRAIEINTADSEKIIYEGAVGRKQHGLIKKLLGILRSTPTFAFIDSELNVVHKHKGIELKEDEFMKSLTFFTTNSFEHQTWKEYLKKE